MNEQVEKNRKYWSDKIAIENELLSYVKKTFPVFQTFDKQIYNEKVNNALAYQGQHICARAGIHSGSDPYIIETTVILL